MNNLMNFKRDFQKLVFLGERILGKNRTPKCVGHRITYKGSPISLK